MSLLETFSVMVPRDIQFRRLRGATDDGDPMAATITEKVSSKDIMSRFLAFDDITYRQDYGVRAACLT